MTGAELVLALLLASPSGAEVRHVERRMPVQRPPAVPRYGGRTIRLAAPRAAAPASTGQITGHEHRNSNVLWNFKPPAKDGGGRKLSAAPADPTKAPAFAKTLSDPKVASFAQDERERDGRFHWHAQNGLQLSHWYDRDHGHDWIGYYQGGRSLWTVNWKGHTWWREPRSGRWLSYWKDQWWWRAPTQVYYVYLDGQFYAWNQAPAGVTLVPEEAGPPPLQAPVIPVAAPDPGPKHESKDETLVVSSKPEFTYSADGTRMVQIEGAELTGYLWDLTRPDGQAKDEMIKDLGDGIVEASFNEPADGKPLLLVVKKQAPRGGVSTLVLDSRGNPVEELPARAAPPPPPDFGTPGEPGFDAPGGDLLPPSDAPAYAN